MGFISVFLSCIGSGISFYMLKNLYNSQNSLTPGSLYQIMLRNDKDFLPTQVCYKLNLKGPGVNIQTACSTSLVAVHFACQSLLNQECDMALAGDVSVQIPQKTGYLYEDGMILSPDGHCRAFDKDAKGTVPGSGCGIVVLKRLEHALNDNDSIYAVIKGTAVNNDGSLKVGYTAPGVEGQAAVISEAQAVAQINPETITYIEAHGTGTSLGDPVEISALTQAFRADTSKKQFCAIGSVKTNIGHTDAAAGVAGLIKAALALKNKAIPPSLDFKEPNPEIDFENSPFYVSSKLSEWKRDNNVPLRAGISAFGIGGTNAHVILEQAPYTGISKTSRTWHLIILSAKTESALNMAAANLAKYFKQNPDISIADAAYTLQAGRIPFNCRMFFVCKNADEIAAKLSERKDVYTGFCEHGQEFEEEEKFDYDSLDLNTEAGLKTLGKFWLKRGNIDYTKTYKDEKRTRIPLPTYPFERERYWVAPASAGDNLKSTQASAEPAHIITDSVEQTIANIWKRHIGTEEINLNDNFFDIGGDSMLTVQIVPEINRLLSVNLSVNDFLESPTISEMAAKIKSAHKSGYSPQSLLVRIQRGSLNRAPLFLIHPVGGNVLFYRELAYNMNQDQPVYGIRAKGTEKDEKPITHVKEMAKAYIKEIQSVQSEGPYILGGASFGGMVAFEIAQQLLSKKQKTALLVMMDTPGPHYMPKELVDDADSISYILKLGADISVSPDKLRKLEPDARLAYFAEQMKVADKALLPAGLTTEELSRFFHLFELNALSMQNYSPTLYQGKIIFFRAKQRDDFIPHHPEKAWLDLAAKGVEIHQVPGNHITMNESPNVQVLAEKLKQYLKKN